MPRGTGDVPVESNLTYRIPVHNRFPSWPLHKKQRLVESVLKDYPIHAIILTRHYDPESGDEYHDVEDGQTRMTSLQEFLTDGFACEPGTIGNGLKFSELSKKLQTDFTSYQVTVEIFKSTPGSDEEMAIIFGLLNSGKPLGDNDKFYSRLTTSPVMMFIAEVKGHADLREDFNKFVGPIGTGKTRKLLGDMVGAILAVATRGALEGGDACITTSYEMNHKYLRLVLTAEQKGDVIAFFCAYFARLHEAIDTTSTRPQKRYGKLSGALGLSISAWVNNGSIPESVSWYVKKVFYDRDYEPNSFRQLTVGDRRNCQGAAVRRRMEKVELQWRIDHHLEIVDLESGLYGSGGSSASVSTEEDEEEEDEEEETL